MTQKAKAKRGGRPCLFCMGASGSRASREHIWPDWAAPLLPTRDSKREEHYVFKDGYETLKEVRKDYARQGSPSAIKHSGPCKSCNETWMSRIEEGAKPILITMLERPDASLNRLQTRILAHWSFLKFCVIAGAVHEQSCVSDAERRQFFDASQIPQRYSAWVFRHDALDWYDRYRWFGSYAYDPRKPGFRPDIDGPHNVNTLALGFGPVLFLCFYQWGYRIDTGFSRKSAAKLWPMRASGGLQMPERALNEDAVNGFAHILPLMSKGLA